MFNKLNNLIKRGVVCISAAALLFAYLPWLPTAAEETVHSDGISVISECDGRTAAKYIDREVDGFNKATVDWKCENCTAESVTDLKYPPYNAFEGSRMLLVSPGSDNEKASRISVKPGVDSASGCRFFIASVYLTDADKSCELSVTVSTKKVKFSKSVTVTGGGWRVICFDLEASGLTGKPTEVQFGFDCRSGIAFDICGFSTNENAVLGLRFLSESYSALDCSVISDAEKLSVSLSGEGQYIETSSPALTDFSGGVGIKLKYNNLSDCRSISLYYTTLSTTEYSERFVITEKISSGAGSVVFPIPEAYIGSFRFFFDGACDGAFEILSVTPCACYPSPSYPGSISDCLVGKDKKSITVSGRITDGNAEKYAGCSVYLYELELFEEAGTITTARPAKSETVMGGDSFSFTFPVSDDRGELLKKYAALVYTSGVLVPLGNAVSVTNPEVFAPETGNYSRSVKGITPVTAPSVLDGTAHTSVDIHLEKLVTLSGEGVIYHSTGGSTYAFDEAYVSALDKTVKELAGCGIGVNFSLRLGKTDDMSLSSLLCHPESDAEADGIMFNTASPEGIRTLGAVSDFLVKRYGTSDGVAGNAESITVGAEINSACKYCNMGSAGLTAFTKAYSAALRTVYNTVKQVSSGFSVYMPLGGYWCPGDTAYPTHTFGAKMLLSSVSSCIKQGGDIEWKIAYDITPKNGVFSWEKDTSDGEPGSLSAAELEYLISETSRENLLCSGTPRQIMLLGTETVNTDDGNELIKYSAEFVYTYLKISQRTFDRITVFIPTYPVSYGKVYEQIDTEYYESTSSFAREIIGNDLYGSLLKGAGSSVIKRKTETVQASGQIPSAVKSETEIFGFGSSTSGWYEAVGCRSLKSGTSVGEKGQLLSVLLSPPENGYGGISVDFKGELDLSAAEYICFESKAAVLPEGVHELEITVVFRSGSSYSASVGKVSDSEWGLTVCKLPEWINSLGCDGMTVYVSSTDGSDIGDPTLLLGSIRALSTTRSEKELNDAIKPEDRRPEQQKTVTLSRVIAVSAVLLTAVTVEAIRIIKHKDYADT